MYHKYIAPLWDFNFLFIVNVRSMSGLLGKMEIYSDLEAALKPNESPGTGNAVSVGNRRYHE